MAWVNEDLEVMYRFQSATFYYPPFMQSYNFSMSLTFLMSCYTPYWVGLGPFYQSKNVFHVLTSLQLLLYSYGSTIFIAQGLGHSRHEELLQDMKLPSWYLWFLLGNFSTRWGKLHISTFLVWPTCISTFLRIMSCSMSYVLPVLCNS